MSQWSEIKAGLSLSRASRLRAGVQELCEAKDARTRRVAERIAADQVAVVAALVELEAGLLTDLEECAPERAKRWRRVLDRASAGAALDALTRDRDVSDGSAEFDPKEELSLPGAAAEMDAAHKIIVALRVFPDAGVQAFGDQLDALLGHAQSKTHVMLDTLAQRATHFENEWIKIRDRAFGKASESRNSGKGASGDGKGKPPRPPKQTGQSGDQESNGEDAPNREDRWANRNRNGKGERPMPHDYEEQEQFHFPETLTRFADGSFRGPLGEFARQIGVDTVTELKLMPARYCLLLHHYPRFFCDESQTFHQSPRKQRLLGSTWVSNAFVADAIVSKYLDGLPFYRQAKIHAREGLKIDRSTLIRWSNMVGALLSSPRAGMAFYCFAPCRC